MKTKQWFLWLVIAALTASILAPGFFVVQTVDQKRQPVRDHHTQEFPAVKTMAGKAEEEETLAEEWIIRWIDGSPPAEFMETSVIHHVDEDLGVTVASPANGQDLSKWVDYWRGSGEVEYMHPNRRVQISARPNDELLRFQSYLGPIQAEKAWDRATGNSSIIIGLVDTGVDLDHPDLAGNLVPGVNLLDESRPPEDDHGHGTSVAGVIAATGNNQTGISGILWNARIMPIKALDSDGSGSEALLGRGIKYAVDHGAKIVVLSLGLYKYSNYLQDIVHYAENRGVLLVAASGNDGEAVKYPAAYPTVLAVGGVDANKQVLSKSNRGPELDLVAPWRVFTTALGGGYGYNEGTSMAAPQVAAVAALLWSQHPDWEPYQIRNQLRQSAEDIGSRGWDPVSGYGLLRADLALSMPYREDIYEPNNTRDQAQTLAIDSMASAELSGAGDADWFRIPVPYDGTIVLDFGADSAANLGKLQAQYIVDGQPARTFADLTKPVAIKVSQGTGLLRISAKQQLQSPVSYQVTTKFIIYADPFEDNDRQYKAYTLPANIRSLKGTFHQLNDQDWFVFHVQEKGTLQVKASGNSYRMDLALWIEREEGTPIFVDNGIDGEPEVSRILDVFPGKYYIRVTNESVSQESHPVTGEYTLYIDFAKILLDPNEPNNKAYQATAMRENVRYEGNFDSLDDEDWYSFTVKQDSYVSVRLGQIPANQLISVNLQDARQRQIRSGFNEYGKQEFVLEQKLSAGTYYLKLKSSQSMTKSFYHLRVSVEPLTAGYRDIAGHWALNAIRDLSAKGIVHGYSDYTFRPDASITRAEAAQILANALHLSRSAKLRHTDLNQNHWAYDAVSKASAAGLVRGYPDGTFRPDRPITRAEMAAMLARALKLPGKDGLSPFPDVPRSHWAYPLIVQLKKQEWLLGYEDGTFRPDKQATRAEFAALIHKYVNRK